MNTAHLASNVAAVRKGPLEQVMYEAAKVRLASLGSPA